MAKKEKQAKAFIGNNQVRHIFKFNPDTVDWGYHENIRSQPTLGGRVIQILSVGVDDMTFQGVCGSRAEIQRFAVNMLKVMKWCINHQKTVQLHVPSRRWKFHVYPTSIPQLGWDAETSTYPFQMMLKVEEDLGVKTKQILKSEIAHIARGVGYSEDWHGGNADQFQQIITTIMSSASGGSSSGDVGTGGGGSGGITPGSVSQFDKVYASCASEGACHDVLSPEDTMRIALATGYNQQSAVVRVAIAMAESGLHPGVYNSGGDRGILQINDVHNLPHSLVYNPVASFQRAKNWSNSLWCTYCTSGCASSCVGSSGAYRAHLPTAQRALQNVLAANNSGSGGHGGGSGGHGTGSGGASQGGASQGGSPGRGHGGG